MRGKQVKLLGWATVAFTALLVGIAPRSFAQEIAPTGQYEENGLGAGSSLYRRYLRRWNSPIYGLRGRGRAVFRC